MKIKKILVIMILSIVAFLFGCTARMAGNYHLNQGNYSSAIENYQEVLSENPEDWKTKEKLGIAYFKNNQIGQAIEELKDVLAQDPDAVDANYYLGLAQLKAGERGKAIENWETIQKAEKSFIKEAVEKQLTLLKINDSLQFAKQALAREAELQTRPPEPNTVAVLYFQDLTPNKQFKYLQKALASMIITDFSQVNSLKVIERVRVQYLLEEMELAGSGIMDQKTAPRTGRLLGAEHLVVGSLDSGSIQNQTGVASTTKQTVIASFKLSEDQERFFELQKKIVNNVLKVLDTRLSSTEKMKVNQTHTKSLKAANFYGQALDFQDKGQWKMARLYYQRALREDPNFRLAKGGNDSCPGDSAPSIGELSQMAPTEIAEVAETSVSAAAASQESSVESSAQASVESSTSSGGSEGDAGRGRQESEKGSISVSW